MDPTRPESAPSSMEILFHSGCLDSISRSEEEAITINNAALQEHDILALLFVLLGKRGLFYNIRLIDNDVRFDRSLYTTDVPNVVVIPSYYLHVEDSEIFNSSVQILRKSQFLNAPFTRSKETIAPFIMVFLIECTSESLSSNSVSIPTFSANSNPAASTQPKNGTTKQDKFWSIMCVIRHNDDEPVDIAFISPFEHEPKVTAFAELFQTFPSIVRTRLEEYIGLFIGTRLDLATFQVKCLSFFKQRDNFNSGIIAALNISWVLQSNGRLSETTSGTGLYEFEEQRATDEARALLGFSYRSRMREKRKRTTRYYDFEEDEVINFESIYPDSYTQPGDLSLSLSNPENNNNWNSFSKSGDSKKYRHLIKKEDSPTSSSFSTSLQRKKPQVSRYLSNEMRHHIATIFEMLSIENVVKKDIFPIIPINNTLPPLLGKSTPVKARLTNGSRDSSQHDHNSSTLAGHDTDGSRPTTRPYQSSETPIESTPSSDSLSNTKRDIESLRKVAAYIQSFDFVANFCPKEVKHFSPEDIEDFRSHFLKKVAFPSCLLQTLVEAGEKSLVTKDTILAGIRKTIESIQIPDSFTPDETLTGFLKTFGKKDIKELFLMDSAMTYETTKLGRSKKLLCKYRDPLHFDLSSGTLELKYRKGDSSNAKPHYNNSSSADLKSHVTSANGNSSNGGKNNDTNNSCENGSSNNSTTTTTNGNTINHGGNLRQGELLVSALDICVVADYALDMFDDQLVPKPSKYVPQALQSLARTRFYTTTKALMKVFNNHFTRRDLLLKRKRGDGDDDNDNDVGKEELKNGQSLKELIKKTD